MKTKHLFILIFICVSSFAYAQNVEPKTNFNKIVTGQTEVTVRELVGVPSRVEPFVTINIATNDTTTYWVYPNLYTIAFKNHLVDYLERDRILFLQKVQQWNNPQNKDGIKLKYGQ